MKQHYYSNEDTTHEKSKDGYGKTACGRPGRNVGGLIAYFFSMTKLSGRCKICNDRFRKENE